jgi:hypothetical protein
MPMDTVRAEMVGLDIDAALAGSSQPALGRSQLQRTRRMGVSSQCEHGQLIHNISNMI